MDDVRAVSPLNLMFVTIAIATYNQASPLRRALGSLAGLTRPVGVDHEILVVDNNSSDETRQVLEELTVTLAAKLRTVRERRQGLSHARNCALEAARGDVVCFMDDDAVAEPGWLVAHVDAYGADDQVVGVGGPIRLCWPDGQARPPWLAPDLDWYLSAVDAGPQRQLLCYPRHPYGCNMSVKREVAREVGGFSTRLGRIGMSLISNEERHFFYKIEQAGGRILYEPAAVVYHMVPRERLSKRFFLRRAYAQGVSDVVFQKEIAHDRGHSGWRAKRLLAAGRLLTAATLKGLGGRLCRRDDAACFVRFTQSAYAAGCIAAVVKGRMPSLSHNDSNPR